MAFVYILYSHLIDKHYIGACSDLERRLNEHNAGHSKFTRKGRPWKLLYSEVSEDLQTAYKRERQIKNMKSRKYLEDLVAGNGKNNSAR